jgi:hypothetical protein
VFLVQAEEMEGAVVYTILLIKDGVWDNINDIVGNKRRLEAGLQYENNLWGHGARGTRIPRLTIHMVTFLEGGGQIVEMVCSLEGRYRRLPGNLPGNQNYPRSGVMYPINR